MGKRWWRGGPALAACGCPRQWNGCPTVTALRRRELDLAAIAAVIHERDRRGKRLHALRMTTSLVLYACCKGTFLREGSSAIPEVVALRVIARGSPSHGATINDFRPQRRDALAGLLRPVLTSSLTRRWTPEPPMAARKHSTLASSEPHRDAAGRPRVGRVSSADCQSLRGAYIEVGALERVVLFQPASSITKRPAGARVKSGIGTARARVKGGMGEWALSMWSRCRRTGR